MYFYLTFGSQYSHQPHPWLVNAHPEGWYLVVARDEDAARHLVHAVVGSCWSNLYTKEEFEADYFPRGELGSIRATVISKHWTGLVMHRLAPTLVGPTQCCGRKTSELPESDQLTTHDELVTCDGKGGLA